MIDALTTFITTAGWLAPFWYIASFIVSAVVPIIPTPLIGALGGTAFGFVPAVLYGLVGLGLGAFTALWISRHFGRRLFDLLMPAKARAEWDKLLGIESVAMWGVIFFILNLDIAVIVAGLSTFPIRSLWIAAMIARIPWLVAAAWFGHVILVSDAVLLVVLILLVPFIWGLQRARRHIRGWLIRFGGRNGGPA